MAPSGSQKTNIKGYRQGIPLFVYTQIQFYLAEFHLESWPFFKISLHYEMK